jgi:hypothetical protein
MSGLVRTSSVILEKPRPARNSMQLAINIRGSPGPVRCADKRFPFLSQRLDCRQRPIALDRVCNAVRFHREADMVFRITPFDEPELISRRLLHMPYALYGPAGGELARLGDGEARGSSL